MSTRRRRMRVLGGGGGVAGIQLPQENLLFLFDPAVGVFSDTDLTTPAEDGGAVRGFRDRSSSAYAPVQAGASTLCPTYRASVDEFGGRPALEFDGDDYLQVAIPAPILGNRTLYTVYVVFRYSAASGDRYLYSEGNSGSNTQWVGQLVNGGKFRAFHVSDAAAFPSPLLSNATNTNDNEMSIFALERRAAASWRTLMQGFEDKTDVTNIGTTTTNQLTIGALGRSSVSSQITAQIALIAAYAANNHATIMPLLRSYFGVTYFDNPVKTFFVIGDSKTVGSSQTTPNRSGGAGYPAALGENLTTATGQKWRELIPRYAAHSGFTINGIKNAIDADLALVSGTPDVVLVNMGVNDFPSMPNEATHLSDIAYILDAVHTKWANAKVYIAYPDRRNFGTQADTLAGRIDTVLSTRSAWASAGHDERVWFRNGEDDFTTYSTDGIHYNNEGTAEAAAQWQTAMGLS